MNKLILAITAALAVVGAVTYFSNNEVSTTRFLAATSDVDAAWTHWKQTTGKSYGTNSEETYRKSVFTQNYSTVSATNSNQSSYKLSMNKYADMTNSEFKAQYRNLKASTRTRNPVHLPKATSASVDWRGTLTTGVKDQGQCGSCWAFSTTGGVEGFNAKNTGTVGSFSEQQLVDCSGSYGNQGCNGGLMDDGYQYVIDHGLQSESSYSYTARDGSCSASGAPAVTMTAFADVDTTDAALANAVAIQPISVAIDANPIQFYSNGIFNDCDCGNQLDHGVLAVGYGSEEGQDYFIVKNSWGASWGEDGYFRLARRADGVGMCGITMQASYPSA
jgi:cathepsin L